MFRHVFSRMGAERRRLLSPISQTEFQSAEEWHLNAIWEQGHWNQSRFEAWLSQFDDQDKSRSMPGIQRVLFNREYLEHVLLNYEKILGCTHHSQDCFASFSQRSHDSESELDDKRWL